MALRMPRCSVRNRRLVASQSLILGSPARVVKSLSSAQIEGLRRSALGYTANAERFRKGLKKIG